MAVEVFRAQPRNANIGFVDWNPRPLDENMDILREVTLSVFGKTRLSNTYVQSKVNTNILDKASLTLETELEYLTDKEIKGELLGKIESEPFTYPVTLNPKQKKKIKSTSKEIKKSVY